MPKNVQKECRSELRFGLANKLKSEQLKEVQNENKKEQGTLAIYPTKLFRRNAVLCCALFVLLLLCSYL